MTRPQIRVAALVVLAGVVLGVVQAVGWSLLAPGAEVKVLANGGYGGLPTASAHNFTSVAIFTMTGLGIGIVGALVVWRLRSVRGVVGLGALLIGSLVSGLVGYYLAPHLVSGVDPATVGATGAEQVVLAAPVLDTPWVTVTQVAVAALIYTFAAFLSDRPDLESTTARPPVAIPGGGAPYA